MFRDDRKYSMQTNQIKAGMMMLILYKITLNLKFITGDKKDYYRVHQMVIIVIYIYICLYIHIYIHTEGLKHKKQILRELNR